MQFLVNTIRGLNPALPVKSKLEQAKQTINNMTNELFDLKQWLQTQQPNDEDTSSISADEFFEQHFKELDPALIKEMKEHEQISEGVL